MLAITHENGVIQIALPDQHASQAIALFSTALAAAKITEAEAAQEAPKAPNSEYPHSLKHLNAEQAGDIISNYVMDKAERTFGNRYPFHMQRFFRALEKESGEDITREHKKRLIVSGNPHLRGHNPLRKIDAAIEVLGADEVYKFAKAYNFVTGG